MEMSATGIARTKSDQLEIARKSLSRTPSAEALGLATPTSAMSGELNAGSGLPRKASSGGKRLVGSSPGRKGGGAGHHIRKSRSAQLNKLDLDEVSSSTALSRASSASLGFSFSFTGFTPQPEDIIADLKAFSDEETG